MWRKIVSPELLFLLGTLQALFPYIPWYFQGLNPSYRYEVTYLPVLIWGIGYICFWLGTKSVKIASFIKPKYVVNIRLNDFKPILLLVVAFVIVQILLAIRLYGVLPIYGYITGTSNVTEVNEIQRESGFGQLGALTVSLFLLNGFLLILIIKNFESKQKATLLFILIFCIQIFGGLMAGKRQSLLTTIMFLFCGLSIRYNNPLKPITQILNIPTNKIIRFFLFASILTIIVSLMGFISSARTGGTGSEVSGIEEIFNYLQFPLINLEAQCGEIGLGPYKFNFLYPLFSLLPNKIYEGIAPGLSDLPIRPEPTIGAGFYGNIHWGMGLLGIVIYSFVIGLTSKYFYKKSFTSLFHLLVYCQISWTLLSAHTYNHFFNLIFLPIPSFLFFIFCNLFNRSNRQHIERESV
ncbi:MAG: oligosaccharide repeat unit polymerase [Cyanomargarita calcarea GSE-NOS-MK-12-04C]|jgi:oligosaccharide repeat unit polymerase|uniref:Oligosaccharide repeat unit polymerase n=1 Tax=Cyanomargarita calcarea GSE-NOS-MK-12-04C TaxID=2839659 RepID=A0A951QH53_9CYAN|nr:oligosaccharide repeat unit polymerase [Cyanomargarita calcarea GSE-NOS-MK-12-04C]